jgi:hypothetical protein
MSERTCHAECAARKYCAVRHREVCKTWHEARKTGAATAEQLSQQKRLAKNEKERARRAAKKVAS